MQSFREWYDNLQRKEDGTKRIVLFEFYDVVVLNELKYYKEKETSIFVRLYFGSTTGCT